MEISDLFQLAVDKNASDIHLQVSIPPVLRVSGQLDVIDSPPLTAKDIWSVLNDLATDDQREAFRKEMELDFAFTYSGDVRLRVNAFRQKGNTGLAFRLLHNRIPSVEELGLPVAACQELINKPYGLVVVTGPTGSGKTTTLAAMIEYLNHYQSKRVITIEDPIEYEYLSDRCIISQRELGFDTHSFAAALKYVLRQNPDVILVGEMRDLETAAAALTVAETGHLVLTTGHAPSTSVTIERIIDLFPGHQQSMALARLSAVLQGVLTQRLVPRVDSSGRVPAVEVMHATPAVKNLIRENKTFQLPNVIRTGSQSGMCSMDEALAALYFKKLISKKELFANCGDEKEIARMTGESRVSVSVF